LKKVAYLILIPVFLVLTGCAKKNIETQHSKKIISKSAKMVEGKIAVTGNEPFTKLSVVVNDSTVYILKCDSATGQMLRNNQGKLFKIIFDNKVKTSSGEELTVIKVEKSDNK